ncbi:hypothetical protein EsDP_00006712 [Epichloe bromicola]|uniref:Uncharacterized protein n=1 Tax=Epichloe bromicola TaxID=79588 RepID=A0ABQ0CYF1_9HYPO
MKNAMNGSGTNGNGTNGNWSLLTEPKDLAIAKENNNSQDPDGNYSPTTPTKGGQAMKNATNGSGTDSTQPLPTETKDLAATAAAKNGPGPDGNWSPQKPRPTPNDTKDGKTQNGHGSPLRDASNGPDGDGNSSSKDTGNPRVSGQKGNWSPLKDPPTVNGGAGPVNAGNWSPLNDPPKMDGASNGPDKDGS